MDGNANGHERGAIGLRSLALDEAVPLPGLFLFNPFATESPTTRTKIIASAVTPMMIAIIHL